MKTEAVQSYSLPPAAVLQMSPGFSSTRPYKYHESAQKYFVLDLDCPDDLITDFYPTTLKRFRKAGVRHLELQSHISGDKEWLIGQPVNNRNQILRHGGCSVGPVTLYLATLERRTFHGEMTMAPLLARAAIDGTMDHIDQNKLRFVFAENWYDDYTAPATQLRP